MNSRLIESQRPLLAGMNWNNGTNYIAWFAGAHSTDSGGNTGITFASMESLLANTICPTFMTPTYPTRKTESVI